MLNLSKVLADYTDKRGYPPYDPRLMLRLLTYGTPAECAHPGRSSANAWTMSRSGSWLSAYNRECGRVARGNLTPGLPDHFSSYADTSVPSYTPAASPRTAHRSLGPGLPKPMG
ncbi:hypothetical protein GCM10010307_48220 [Streptomyces vastus]|uniref:Uncharacterized protein n=1 Tax=Streptomyces vastus TaxID=285451 RepID=A0ABN3R5W4_9ACTN